MFQLIFLQHFTNHSTFYIISHCLMFLGGKIEFWDLNYCNFLLCSPCLCGRIGFSKFSPLIIEFVDLFRSKTKSTFTLFRGNHDETPFWRDEMTFCGDETCFFEFLSCENLAIFALFWGEFEEKHGDTEGTKRHREIFFFLCVLCAYVVE